MSHMRLNVLTDTSRHLKDIEFKHIFVIAKTILIRTTIHSFQHVFVNLKCATHSIPVCCRFSEFFDESGDNGNRKSATGFSTCKDTQDRSRCHCGKIYCS